MGRGSVSSTARRRFYPEEVRAPEGHPDVFNIGGVPDPRYSQQVAAVVLARPGCRQIVVSWTRSLRSRSRAYKVPRSAVCRQVKHFAPAGKPDYRAGPEVDFEGAWPMTCAADT